MTLNEAKKYLKVDYDDDDIYINNLIEISDIYIESCVGIAFKSDEKAIKLASILQFKLIHDMYERRGTEVPENTKKDNIVITIMDKLSNFEGENG